MARPRSVLPLACLTVCAAGFAPAPVYKGPKGPLPITAKEVMGDWAIVSMLHLPDKTPRDLQTEATKQFTFTEDSLAMGDGQRVSVTYRLTVDGSREPAEFDLYREGQVTPHGRGLIRREGAALRLLYAWGDRPTGFKDQRRGVYMLLQRK